MLNRIVRSSLIAVFLWLAGSHSTSAQIIPNPNPQPLPTIPSIIGIEPTPTPPATPTTPPISPPPVATPTVPPLATPYPSIPWQKIPPTPTVPPYITPSPIPIVPPITPPPVATPTVPPVSPPPVASPTVPPVPNPNALAKADPQLARAVVYYGQNGSIPLLNDRGRFQKVALLADEVITLLVTLSPLDYGKPAAIELLDGGSMSTAVTVPELKSPLPIVNPSPKPPADSVSVSATTPAPNPLPVFTPPPVPDPSTLLDTGTLINVPQSGQLLFAFKPGSDAGRHRISVIVGGNQYFLQFWRQDPGAPNNNPRMPHAY